MCNLVEYSSSDTPTPSQKCGENTPQTPLRRNVFAVSDVFQYSANCLRGDQTALGELSHEIKCKYFKTLLSEGINKRLRLLRRMHLNCSVILACKLYLGNNFWKWDTGFASWSGKLSPLNLTVILLQPLNLEEPEVVNMTKNKDKKGAASSGPLPSQENQGNG